MRLGISLARYGDLDITAVGPIAADLRVPTVEVDAAGFERFLGAPSLPVVAHAGAEDGFETGMLPLEEEILQDELELARVTIAARRQGWRRQASVAPVESVRVALADAGVDQVFVRCDGLAALSDDELAFASSLAGAAGTLVTGFSADAVRRLAAMAPRSRTPVAFVPRTASCEDDIATVLASSPGFAVVLDSRAGASGVAAALDAHPGRVAQVYVAEDGMESLCLTVQALEQRGWPCPATLVLDPPAGTPIGPALWSAVSASLDRCRACLRT